MPLESTSPSIATDTMFILETNVDGLLIKRRTMPTGRILHVFRTIPLVMFLCAIAGVAIADNVTGRLVILSGVYPRQVSTRVFQNWLECRAPGSPSLNVGNFLSKTSITPSDMEGIARINGLESAQDLTNVLRGAIARNVVE